MPSGFAALFSRTVTPVCSFALLSLPAAALPIGEVCPSTVRVDTGIINPPEGWQSMDARAGEALERRSIAFFAGSINGHAELKPQHIKRGTRDGAAIFVHRYVFVGPFPEGVSMACSYASTSMVVHKILPGVPKQCTVSFSERPLRGEIAQVTCEMQ